MTMLANLHEIIPIAIERTLDSLVGGIVLCGVAWTWLRVARRQNSASRFFILFILLIGIAVLPFLGLSWLRQSNIVISSDAHSLITLPAHSAEYLFVAWAAIASVLLARVMVGFFQLRRLKQSCAALDTNELDPQTQSALRESARRVQLCVSDQVHVPTALGFAAPAKIAIPTWLIHQLSPEELHHLVLHELAHLRRWDDWTNLAQRVMGAMLFFHPAVWWLQNRISLEREMACDECVLAETGNARAYAKSLASIAERSFVRRTVALAQAAVSRLHDTTLRVTKILTPQTSSKSHSTVWMFASAAAFGSISVAVALYSPNLVGFAEPPMPANFSASVIPAVALSKSTPKQVMASMKFSEPAPKTTWAAAKVSHPQRRNVTRPAVTSTVARVENKHSLFVPVKATQDQVTIARPAMLVVWQESYSADGSVLTIQQSYWRVVVFQRISPKEQPAKTT
jgi:beta-lactamase regulating signal transducer with metallopeptidase domain